jgi:serine phosphatase RsbU (regulator of sigma subunit)
MNVVARQCAPTAAGVVSACLADVREFAGASPGLDDVTLLAIQRRG